jgi:hypothetical protein
MNSPPTGQVIAKLINDMRHLAGTLDSFALSFTLAWKKHPGQQREPSPTQGTSQPERTNR